MAIDFQHGFQLVSTPSAWQRTGMLKSFQVLCIGFCLAGLAGGCATTSPTEIKPLTETQLRNIFSKAKDPRNFWITVYQSDNQIAQFAGANRLHPEHLAQRDFANESSPLAPVVSADIGRFETFTALIDTTAARSWLDFATFERAQGVPLGPPAYAYVPKNVNDRLPGYACVLTKVRFDQLHMENAVFHFRAATGSLGYLARGEEHPMPDAILGCDILKSFAFVQIDYPKRSVILSATTEYAPEEQPLMAQLPLREIEGAFAVDGEIDGEKKTFILDSAGDFEIAMDNPPTNQLKQISIGDLVFRNAPVVDSKDKSLGLLTYPRIGRRLLAKFNVTFAPKKKLVYFERPVAKKSKS